MAHRLNDARIYVGNLPPDIRNKDIEDIFYKYGRILNVDLKNKKGPPFAFVEFEDARDAQDAVHAKDGYNYDGYRLRVEFPRGTANGPSRSNHSSSYRGGDSSYSNGGRGGRNNNGSGGKRTDYRVIISGLPPSGSWQDLKDHMREAGDVVYADVFKDGTGVVEFMKYDDMKYALRKLDDSKFTSHEGEATYIRVREDGDHGKRRSSRRSRSHSRGNSRGNSRGRNTRASPSYSPARKSRSRSRSSRSRS